MVYAQSGVGFPVAPMSLPSFPCSFGKHHAGRLSFSLICRHDSFLIVLGVVFLPKMGCYCGPPVTLQCVFPTLPISDGWLADTGRPSLIEETRPSGWSSFYRVFDHFLERQFNVPACCITDRACGYVCGMRQQYLQRRSASRIMDALISRTSNFATGTKVGEPAAGFSFFSSKIASTSRVPRAPSHSD